MAEDLADRDRRLFVPNKNTQIQMFCRYQLIRDYTLKTLRLKIDKWNKLWSSDEQRALLIKFVESGFTKYVSIVCYHTSAISSDSIQQIVISQTPGGAIQIHTDWARYLTNKGVYFIKRENQGIPEPEYGPLLNYRVIESIRLQGWSQCGLVLGLLRSPKASLEPQGRAQITFRYRRHIYGLNGESR